MNTDRYIVKDLVNPEKLAKVINACPGGHELHSVIPVADSQHGTSHFVVIFHPLRPM